MAAALCAVVFLGLVAFDFLGRFALDARWHEVWRMDELLAAMFTAALFLAFVYWRRLDSSEKSLRRGERAFRSVVDKAADAIVIHDLSGEILDANQSAWESLGYSREELVGRNVSEVEEGFDPEGFQRIWGLLLSGEQVTVDEIHKRKDGSTFPVESRLSLIEAEGERAVLSLARDVSESRKAMEEIRRSEARNRAVL